MRIVVVVLTSDTGLHSPVTQVDLNSIYDVRSLLVGSDPVGAWQGMVARERPTFGILDASFRGVGSGGALDLQRKLTCAVPTVKVHLWPGGDRICRRMLDALMCDTVLTPMKPPPETLTVAALRPRTSAPPAGPHSGSTSTPLVSIFTTTYRSGEIARTPYESLLRQTYSRWEWVVYDDSPAGEDGTWALLRQLASEDPRVRVLRGADNSGIIGEAKLLACRACRGALLVELDHDDELTPRCLEWIVAAHAAHPDAGFIYTEGAMVRWDPKTRVVESDPRGDPKCESFGEGFAWGLGGHCLTCTTVGGADRQRVTMLCTPEMGETTLRHIVSVPNHARAWTRVAYDRCGGHNPGLAVADDYELILRTILTTAPFSVHPVVRIREVGYIQHVSTDAATPNHTLSRNALIQHLVDCISELYADDIGRLAASRLPPGTPHEECPLPPPNTVVDLPGTWEPHPVGIPLEVAAIGEGGDWDVTVVIPTFGRPQRLRAALDSVAAQTYPRWRVVVVGDACPDYAGWSRELFDRFRDNPATGEIGMPRAWNLERNRGGAGFAARNYALRHLVSTEWVAYLDDDDTWTPDHLERAFAALKRARTPRADFAVASLWVEGRPILSDRPRKYRTDTSCVVHRRRLVESHGYWRAQADVGYAHDWDLVSRWTDGGVPWVATLEATVHYNTEGRPAGIGEHLLGRHGTA